MGVGDVTPPEGKVFRDHRTGTCIHQLTDCRAHSHHAYFTNEAMWDAGERMVIASHRGNCENLYSVELASGELTQLTDFGPGDRPALQRMFVNPARDEVYFPNAGEVLALDLHTRRRRALCRLPDGYRGGILSCTADGKTLCTAVTKDLSDSIRMDLGHGYVGFAEYSAARPNSRILAIPVDGAHPEVIHEEDFWLSHVNTSPAMPDKLTFCHEGPWRTIDQRMWMLDIPTGTVRPLRRQVPGEAIGHEYWFADGRRVGYHGTKDEVHRFGWVMWDESDGAEYDFPHGSFHFHSLDEALIVGDGGRDRPHLLLWRLTHGAYDGPRILLTHRGSWHTQIQHVHPRMFTAPDGRVRIVYSADPNGYSNVFIADVADFDSLPELEDDAE